MALIHAINSGFIASDKKGKWGFNNSRKVAKKEHFNDRVKSRLSGQKRRRQMELQLFPHWFLWSRTSNPRYQKNFYLHSPYKLFPATISLWIFFPFE